MRRPGAVVGLVLVLMGLMLAGCGGSSQPPVSTPTLSTSSAPTDTPAGETSTQQKFTSQDGGFSVSFPGNPNETSSSTSTDIGDVSVHTFTYADSSGLNYNVAYNDYPADKVPADSEQLLSGAVSGIGKTDKLISQQSTTQQGHPAITAEFDAAGTNHLFYKGVTVKNRLYQIIVATPAANAETYRSDAQKFLDSFELTSP